MGVPGLWDFVNKVGRSRSLAHLAVVEGFQNNISGRRAYRIGIDVYIWFHHAPSSKGGENNELRLLFFRVARLARLPILPLFVFDGRQRPKVKRGSRLGKSGSHGLSQDFKTILDAFGMEWREAPGEAEAELAYLNQKGYIDAVMTDDCDALVFGACTLIKNKCRNPPGNKGNPARNPDNNESEHHVMIYTSEDVKNNPKVRLSKGGLILFALLSGGDYHKGVEKIGKVIAYGLVQCGFGDELLQAFEQHDKQGFQRFLPQWRAKVNLELKTNSRKLLEQRPPITLPQDFPDLEVFTKYANPLTSGQDGSKGGGHLHDQRNLNLAQLAGLCEKFFGEWGFESAIIKRFRGTIWPAAVMHVLRRAAVEADERERWRRRESGMKDMINEPAAADAVGTPASLVQRYLNCAATSRSTSEARFADAFVNQGSRVQLQNQATDIPDPNPLVVNIVGRRKHASTDKLLEYCVDICPIQLVLLARSGIKGTRHGGTQNTTDIGIASRSRGSSEKSHPESQSTLKLWIPATIMHQVHPAMTQSFEVAMNAKQFTSSKRKGRAKAKGGTTTAQNRVTSHGSDKEILDSTPTTSSLNQRVRKRLPTANTPQLIDFDASDQLEEDEHDIEMDIQPGCGISKKQAQSRLVIERRRDAQEAPDPWFTVGNLARGQFQQIPSRAPGILFSFPDPETFGLDDGEDYELGAELHVSDYEEDHVPRSRFDRLFDQIIDAPKKKGSAKGRHSLSGVPLKRGADDGAEKPAKKRRVASAFRATADAAVSALVATTSHQKLQVLYTYIPTQYGDDIPDPSDSDSDDLPPSIFASSEPRKEFRTDKVLVYPHSSQDSQLVSSDEDIIDLT